MASLSASVQKVQAALRAQGLDNPIVEHEQTTRTAQDAARAVGCDVAQIAKSLVFRGSHSGRALLVICSGVNRVDEHRLAELAGEPVEKPDAAFVLAATGFVIGGVPPLAHAPAPLPTWIDEDLLRLETIWAAAGTPNAVFPVSPEELLRMTGGRAARVKPGE